jgi:hypothetical protein
MRASLSAILIVGAVALGGGSAKADFIPVNATYTGLLFETNGLWQQSSGLMTITTTSRGRYSARLQIGATRFALAGWLDANGSATRDVLRRWQNPLTVQFQISQEDPDLIFGAVTDGNWTADLIADRAVYNGRTTVSPDAGQYTMIIPGDFTSTNTPGGDSYGTITIDKAGRIRFSGRLADGTSVSQSTFVSKGGQWPLYAPLYRGEGSLYGWMLFNGSEQADVLGDITWIKPQMPSTWYYPSGFAINVSAWGSSYRRPPRGTPILNVPTAALEFNSANQYRGITNHVTIDGHNRVTNLSANSLQMAFSTATGLFSGWVIDPITWYRVPFRGVVLQRQGLAAGYFRSWDQTGEVWLQGE